MISRALINSAFDQGRITGGRGGGVKLPARQSRSVVNTGRSGPPTSPRRVASYFVTGNCLPRFNVYRVSRSVISVLSGPVDSFRNL